MKAKYILLMAAALVLVIGAVAWAGEYHQGTQLICAQCHTMHYSRSHDFGTGASWDNTWLAAGGPFHSLLRGPVNDLCLSCHDGKTWAPDVYGTNTGTHVREAGALNGSHGSYAPGAGYEDWKGHTLWSTAQAPGTASAWTPDPSEGLECANCHLFHGGGNYRNLWSNAPHGGSGGTTGAYGYTAVTYAKGTNDTTKDVFLRSWTEGAIATNYSYDNTDLNEPSATDSKFSTFCNACHVDFHDKDGVGGTNLRHPTAGVDITDATGHDSSSARFGSRINRVKVMTAGNDWGSYGTAWATPAADLTPTCITCHKGHGNKNAFALLYMRGDSGDTVTEQGDTGGANVRDLCRQCHTQGTPPP